MTMARYYYISIATWFTKSPHRRHLKVYGWLVVRYGASIPIWPLLITTCRTHGAERSGGVDAINEEIARIQVKTLDDNCDEWGITEFKIDDPRQGIVHVIGPEQGATITWHDGGLW